ncbi:unnamed protein product [Rotaria sordida]|uniref:3-oxo-5alpha-steroid 4-dehydrogenase (NADP(+)) n=1 Tax=Rotaria sordida TaxID=392033 RepID=A0A818SVG4_9BILA|nr:unnamed protein product [Rotaria sordida]CAF0823008.1 unnamed protein product [Rotaria sordida]CAF3675333.1 unnamed protein product [Rotaria sordida]CAF3827685.1 unnamed protein product [Rotaria sordida]
MLKYILNDQNFVCYVLPYLWFINSFIVIFCELVLNIKAPYGRYNTNNSGVPARLAWFIQELPSFMIPCYLLYYHWSSVSITKFIIVGLFLIHYFQRVFIFPILIRGGKHSPYLTTILAFIFCCLNSYAIVEEILAYHIYPNDYLLSLRFISGMMIFFIGFILNLQADSILRNLRKDNNQRDYQIPRGGLFEYVSGANFLAESIEWTGYAICAWTLPAFAFSVFVWVNIGIGRAIHHHQFYLEKFKDEYPKNRKAIIPFIL